MLLRKWASLLAVLGLLLQAGLAVSHGAGRMQAAVVGAAQAADSAAKSEIAATFYGLGTVVLCQSIRSDSGKGPAPHGASKPCLICATIASGWIVADSAAPLTVPDRSEINPSPPEQASCAPSGATFWPPSRGPPSLNA